MRGVVVKVEEPDGLTLADIAAFLEKARGAGVEFNTRVRVRTKPAFNPDGALVKKITTTEEVDLA